MILKMLRRGSDRTSTDPSQSWAIVLQRLASATGAKLSQGMASVIPIELVLANNAVQFIRSFSIDKVQRVTVTEA